MAATTADIRAAIGFHGRCMMDWPLLEWHINDDEIAKSRQIKVDKAEQKKSRPIYPRYILERKISHFCLTRIICVPLEKLKLHANDTGCILVYLWNRCLFREKS